MQAERVVHHDQPSLTLLEVCIEMTVGALATSAEIAEHSVVEKVREARGPFRREEPSLLRCFSRKATLMGIQGIVCRVISADFQYY